MRYDDEQADARIYTVVVNGEDQYSIWTSDRPIPAGWKEVGRQGTKKACLEFIEQVWTDMRPLSLRRSSEMSLASKSSG
ncbi:MULTISPECIES: MbtH family protein [unclassified Bradyrhizobium]|uniref:MbtH family protein n=1 Tax=unclassified Bradyrhizobium TaxID=2631580 RepID=UPI00209E6B6D|nr:MULTISPECIES: MbtH family NRPS accessory protein [unclassified Bradyrhizobium]